ncbi:hypothetical protein [Beduinella massiliensis]|uniref:hypothetical protein n=1 Tax=Beduinella massiliensis TaxID=1852363 RepID=UPI0031F987DB
MQAFSAGGKRVRIDLGKRRVYLCDVELHATLRKYSLLPLSSRNTGKEFTSSYIIREIWGAGYGSDTQALRALRAGLRRKAEGNPAKPRYLLRRSARATGSRIGKQAKDLHFPAFPVQ